MKLGEADLEQSYFQAVRKGPDKTIGIILVGLFVILFFSLYLFGLQRVQTVSDHAVGDHMRPTVSEPNPEIGDSIDPNSR